MGKYSELDIPAAATLFCSTGAAERGDGLCKLGAIGHDPRLAILIVQHPALIDTAISYVIGDDSKSARLGLSLLVNLASHGAGSALMEHSGFAPTLHLLLVGNKGQQHAAEMLIEELSDCGIDFKRVSGVAGKPEAAQNVPK